MNTGERIKRARKNASLSQKELGEKLKMSPIMISQYENGIRNPKYETLEKIAEALGVHVSALREDFIERTISDSPLLRAAQKNERPDNPLFQKLLQDRAVESLDMTEDKIELINKYNKLNSSGKKKVTDYAEDLIGNPKYCDDTKG